jgi:CRISPR-associated Cas5-like protein
MKALTFSIKFYTAQFKDHAQKMTRKTYLIPPPSVVAGIFGAILGISKDELVKMSENILAGAEMRFLGGRIVTFSRIFKIDRPTKELLKLLRLYHAGIKIHKGINVLKDIQSLLTIKESEELYLTEYKFALASTDERLIDEGYRRIENLEFEYEIFGGNDYHFVDHIGKPKYAILEKSYEGYGYCPREDFNRIEADSFSIVRNIELITEKNIPVILPVRFLANVNKDFLQVYGAKIISKRELDVVNDRESKIFVYNVKPFLV